MGGADESFSGSESPNFQVGCRTIIIEPSGLAMETRRWIIAGEYIKTTSAVAGCATFVIGNVQFNVPA